eukprot:gnl/MRDRNA2_/MRDRNA2_237031_c0_seq1.p2 gnl/MRDRNA2_/MRDRNA2_237031_c0~~gnl/MRDRNA2_/MRDRNA2_237031_c0_seq1.p2  ORF type:complete len:112 (-),score=3.31 gnl/MRDRNA2_/MRDRNA2_237031_c0_seq1:21-356(-)
MINASPIEYRRLLSLLQIKARRNSDSNSIGTIVKHESCPGCPSFLDDTCIRNTECVAEQIVDTKAVRRIRLEVSLYHVQYQSNTLNMTISANKSGGIMDISMIAPIVELSW